MKFNGNYCTYLSTLSRVAYDFVQKNNRIPPWWGRSLHPSSMAFVLIATLLRQPLIDVLVKGANEGFY
jgi:hypothetical protein